MFVLTMMPMRCNGCSNEALALDGGIRCWFHIVNHWPAASDVHCSAKTKNNGKDRFACNDSHGRES